MARLGMFERSLAAALATVTFWGAGAPLVPAQDRRLLDREVSAPARSVDSVAAEGGSNQYAPSDHDRVTERLESQRYRRWTGNVEPQEEPSDDTGGIAPEAEDSSVELTANAVVGASESKSAVTPQAISLPKAEGSIEGMGESFAPILSSGTATFSVPIALPPGRAGVQPSLALRYASSNGNSALGIGWSMEMPFISRQTDKGIPRYVDDAVWHPEEDPFIYNGGQELVPVDTAAMAAVDANAAFPYTHHTPALLGNVPSDVQGWQQYRARVEGSFMRFFRSPDMTRWIVQAKDGTRFDFGLLPSGDGPAGIDRTSAGALVSEDSGGAGRIFRWNLTRMSDRHGSTVYYLYDEAEGNRYVREIYYVSPASCSVVSGQGGDAVRQRQCARPLNEYAVRVRFDYVGRPDVTTSYISSWRIAQPWRLWKITITSAQENVGERFLVRRYHLDYDPTSFHSLLNQVRVEGRPDTFDSSAAVDVGNSGIPEASLDGANGIIGRLLPPMVFRYSRPPTRGTQVSGFGGVDGTVRNVAASPPHSVDEGRSDLFDVNSDGLPDLIVTDPARYRNADGSPAVGVFFNGFSGDRARPAGQPGGAGRTPNVVFSSAIPVPMSYGLGTILNLSNANIVPMDVDGDGRSDLLHMPRRQSYGYFVPARGADRDVPEISPARQGWRWSYAQVALPQGVTDPRVDFVRDGTFYKVLDVNNDNLIDVVKTTGTGMQTWLNLGWIPGGAGRFGSATYRNGSWSLSADPIESCLLHDGMPVDFSDPELRLGDMNGDGLQDIVRIRRGRVVYWPGRGPGLWGDGPAVCDRNQGSQREIRMSSPPAEVNPELAGVYLMDVNADGADDVVQVRYRDVDVWFNQAGRDFTERLIVRGTPEAPDFAPRVRFADIDGSGTGDLIYGNANRWQFIDFMGGAKPRLLVGVENGLGAHTSIEYGSSAEDYLRDLAAAAQCGASDCDRFTWSGLQDEPDSLLAQLSGESVYRSGGSPVISTVVRAVQTSDQFGVLRSRPDGAPDHQVSRTEFAYHDGYYEGIEREFRGFGAADARAVGDWTHPTQWTRTFFHQGRRPSSIATDRTAENPYEALKGSEYLTDVFDEAGTHLATTHVGHSVRRLAIGLDGRPIEFAYPSQVDEFRFDTSPFAPGLESKTLPSIRFETVPASGGAAVPGTAESRQVVLKGSRFAWLRRTTDRVTNVGHVFQQTNHGRIKDEYEAVEHASTEPVQSWTYVDVKNATGAWLWLDARTFVRATTNGPTYQDFINEYNDVGDALRVRTTPTVPSPTRQFGSDGSAEALVPVNENSVVGTVYDTWGSPRRICNGANPESWARDCLRNTYFQWDSAYQNTVVSETAVVRHEANHCNPGIDCSALVTYAAWDRGLGVVRSVTEPSGRVVEIGYDGLGRLTFIREPGAGDCAGSSVPVHRFAYELTPSGLPINVVTSYTHHACDLNQDAATTMVAQTYVDGLGRPRASMLRAEPSLSSGTRWQQSGVVQVNARGTTYLEYQPSFIATGSPSPQEAVALPSVPSRHQTHDAFGRPNNTLAEDGSPTRFIHHALSTVTCDALDLSSHSVSAGTCSTSRTDGHDRVIDQVLVQRVPGRDLQFHRLFMTYRVDGAVLTVVRAQTESDAPNSPVVLGPGGRPRSVTRSFVYDRIGRRIASFDPDTDSRAAGRTDANRTWRYLYNRVGDLVAVRDPRGCGQNYYYDRVGRLIGEDYVGCTEALPVDENATDMLPPDAISLTRRDVRPVDVRYYYDSAPPWASQMSGAPTQSASYVGRLSAVSDRAQRSLMGYDERGNVTWTAKQVAYVPDVLSEPPSALLDPPLLASTVAGTRGNRVYDTHTYVRTTSYDYGGRPIDLALPSDPDWETLGGSGSPPTVGGHVTYNHRGFPFMLHAQIGASLRPVLEHVTYGRDGQVEEIVYGDSISGTRANTISETEYDLRRRPMRMRTVRQPTETGVTEPTLSAVSVPFDTSYAWDAVSNLIAIEDHRIESEWPAGHKPARAAVLHDALYRVVGIDYDYKTETGWLSTDVGTDWRTARTRTNNDGATHHRADPMRERPAPMISALPSERVMNLTYEFDFLGNMIEWSDDQAAFYERSIGLIGNGFDEGTSSNARPTALYFSSNIRTSASGIDLGVDRGGWVSLDYGEGGNLRAMTVRGQCLDRDAATACYDTGTGTYASRDQHLRGRCVCAAEQHYQYHWDELNRLAQASRYDRAGVGNWQLAVRQRYRYDSSNQRVVKQSREENPDAAEPPERVTLYVYPGDFERRGLVRHPGSHTYAADPTLGTETQYVVAGARIVWKTAEPALGLQRSRRITYPLTDLIQSTSAVLDLESGELVESTTFYPNGGRETHWATEKASLALEPMGFTGKEADEEVGLVYFGERYLISRLGRWASPDPLAIHAVEGGEALNSYHYVMGNLLQTRDPLGLQPPMTSDYGTIATKAEAERTEVEEGFFETDTPSDIEHLPTGNVVANHANNGTWTWGVRYTRNASGKVLSAEWMVNKGNGWASWKPTSEGVSGGANDRAHDELELLVGIALGAPSVANLAKRATKELLSRAGRKSVDEAGEAAVEFAAGRADDFVNLASAKRAKHILTGDGPGSGGHLWPGQPGKTPFPEGWSGDKIMHHVSDIATDPSLTWVQQTGKAGSDFTKAGDPVRFFVIGEREGIRIKVVIEPAGEGIITAHPL